MVLHIYLNTHPPFNAFRHGDAFHSAHNKCGRTQSRQSKENKTVSKQDVSRTCELQTDQQCNGVVKMQVSFYR